MTLTRLLSVAFLAVGLLSLPATSQADWTVLVFLNGDNNLDAASVDDVNEMEANFNNNGTYEIICLWDRYSSGASKIRIRSPQYQTLSNEGELDMGDWTVLRDFVIWGMQNYPADKYFVVCWDHGDGWYKSPPGLDDSPLFRGFSNDDHGSSAGIGIANGDWENALIGIENYLGRNVDVWGFDACLMGMIEVMCEGQPYIDYFVGSEETEPFDGWPYDTIVSWLNSVGGNPTPALFAEYVARRYLESYSTSSATTQSAVRLDSYFTTLLNEVDTFSKNLGAYGGKNQNPLPSCRNNSEEYYYTSHRDLWHFAYNVKNASKAPSVPLEASSQAVMDALDDAVLYGAGEGENDDSHGIAIYYPTGTAGGSYSNLRFGQINFWEDYIDGAATPVELAAFSAAPTDEGVLITWQTQSEQDNLGFMLYRSVDGSEQRAAITRELIPGAGTTALPSSYEHLDPIRQPGRYLYWLQDVSSSGPGDFYGPAVAMITPSELALLGPNPNPVSQEAVLTLSVPAVGQVELSLYDATGRLVETVVDEHLQEGAVRTVAWTAGETVSPGRYVWSLRANSQETTQPMVIVR
jgi:hypothetical protein